LQICLFGGGAPLYQESSIKNSVANITDGYHTLQDVGSDKLNFIHVSSSSGQTI
jgi:hypothetical protein